MAEISLYDRFKAFKDTFKYPYKLNSAIDGVVKLVDTAGSLPKSLKGLLTATRPLKVVNGLVAIEQLVTSIKTALKPGTISVRIQAAWRGVEALRDMSAGAENACKLAHHYNFVSKKALAWITIKNYALTPVSVISSLVSIYQTGEKALYLENFREGIKIAKQDANNDQVQAMKNVCEMLLIQEPKLRKMNVITNECKLRDRLNDIVARLDTEDAEAAKKEAKMIATKLKDRISEHYGTGVVETVIVISKFVINFFGTFIPAIRLPGAILGAIIGPLGFASFLYTKRIPRGEILESEKRMLFAHILKGGRKVVKLVTKTCLQAQHLVLNAIRKIPVPVFIRA